MVTLRYLGSLSEKTKTDEEFVNLDSIKDILKYLKKRYGKKVYSLLRSMVITVNGKDIRLIAGVKTVLSDDDTVTFFPPSAGG